MRIWYEFESPVWQPVSLQQSTGSLKSAQASAGLFKALKPRLCISCHWHSTTHLNSISSNKVSLHFKRFGYNDGCVERRHNLEGICRLNIDRIIVKVLKYREFIMLKEEKTLIFEWEIVPYSSELITLAKADHQLQILLSPAPKCVPQHLTSKMRIFLLPPFPIS